MRLLGTLPSPALDVSKGGGFTNPLLQCLTTLMVNIFPLVSNRNFPHCSLCPLSFVFFTARIQEFALHLLCSLQLSSKRLWCDPPLPLLLACSGLRTPSHRSLFLYILEVRQSVQCAIIPQPYLPGKIYCYWNREEGLHVKASGRSLQTPLSLPETQQRANRANSSLLPPYG